MQVDTVILEEIRETFDMRRIRPYYKSFVKKILKSGEYFGFLTENKIVHLMIALKVKEILLRMVDPKLRIKTVHAFMDKATKEDLKDQKVSCRRGCAFCCRQEISIFKEELEIILEIIKERGLKGLNFDNGWCAFLDKETKDCTIYEDRPIVCRSYFVLSDPKFCDTEAQPEYKVTQLSISKHEVMMLTLSLISEGSDLEDALKEWGKNEI